MVSHLVKSTVCLQISMAYTRLYVFSGSDINSKEDCTNFIHEWPKALPLALKTTKLELLKIRETQTTNISGMLLVCEIRCSTGERSKSYLSGALEHINRWT